MKILGKSIWKKKIEIPKIDPPKSHLAFVLLKTPSMPTSRQIVQAFQEFAHPGEILSEVVEVEESEPQEEDEPTALVLDLEGVGRAMIALLPTAIPNGEAQEAFERSLASFSGEPTLEEHSAHLLVSLMGVDESTNPFHALTAFSSLIAAVMRASDAIGVYWGNAGTTHPADFIYDTLIGEDRESAQIMLWNGISRGAEPNGGVSFLSWGMGQLGLPNLYLKTSAEKANETFGWMFDLLSYVAQRGQPIGEGETVGGSETERIVVTYGKSPADDDQVVWIVDAN